MKHTHTVSDKSVYMLVALCTLFVVPVYFYGARVLVIAGVALGAALFCEAIFKGLMFRLPRQTKQFDYSAVITALIVALLMPATIPYHIVAIAVISGLLVAKYPFGGTGKNIFNPAALGVAVVAISFPEQVLLFPTPGTILPFASDLSTYSDIIYAASPASTLMVGGTPQIQRFALLLGNYPGAIGATSVIVLAAVAFFLCLCRVIPWRLVLSSLFTVACYAVLFPRSFTGRTNSVVFELTSGVLLFGLILMTTDPQTSPVTSIGQLFYGVFVALAVMLFRTVGAIEVEIVFVLLFANALTGEFDRFSDFLRGKISFLRNIVASSEELRQQKNGRAGGQDA